MQHVDSILRARWVIPVDARHDVLEHHAVMLDCGKIVDILPIHQVNAHYTATHDTFFDNHAILPGFIKLVSPIETHGLWPNPNLKDSILQNIELLRNRSQNNRAN